MTAKLHGIPASSGDAAGRARVIRSLSDAEAAKPGEVLVLHQATPYLLPILVQAIALVAESGGTLSHIAILARELAKPSVVGVRDVTFRVVTGDWVEVDGARGIVTVSHDSCGV